MVPVVSAPGFRHSSIVRWPGEYAAPAFAAESDQFSTLGKLAFASLWLLVFAIPWEDAITIGSFGTSARLVGMIAVVLGVVATIERGKLRTPVLGHLLMALFVTLAALSYLWSLFPEGTLAQVMTYLQLLVMAWLIWEFAPPVQNQIRLMQAYVFGTFVSGLDTFYEFLSHQESVYQRYAGARLDANDLGLMVALSIPVSYYLLIQSRGKIVWIYRLQLVLAGTTIVLTASRGATLAGIVALTIVPFTHSRLMGRQKIAMLLTLTLIISGVLLFAPETSWERLSTVPSEFARGTLTGRTLIWGAGWELFREHPFFGVGANAFRITVSRVLREPIRLDDPTSPAPPAHNTFLSVLVEQGILGLVVFCSLLGWLMFSMRVMPAPSRQMWSVCLAVWAVGVSSLTWEMRKPTWFFFGLLVANAAAWAAERATLQTHSQRESYYPASRQLRRAIPSSAH